MDVIAKKVRSLVFACCGLFLYIPYSAFAADGPAAPTEAQAATTGKSKKQIQIEIEWQIAQTFLSYRQPPTAGAFLDEETNFNGAVSYANFNEIEWRGYYENPFKLGIGFYQNGADPLNEPGAVGGDIEERFSMYIRFSTVSHFGWFDLEYGFLNVFTFYNNTSRRKRGETKRTDTAALLDGSKSYPLPVFAWLINPVENFGIKLELLTGEANVTQGWYAVSVWFKQDTSLVTIGLEMFNEKNIFDLNNTSRVNSGLFFKWEETLGQAGWFARVRFLFDSSGLTHKKVELGLLERWQLGLGMQLRI